MSHLLRRTVSVATLSVRGGLIARSGRSLMVSSSASYSGAAASTARRWINIGVIAAASAGLAYAVKESEVVEAAGVENGGINSKAFTPLTLKDRKHVTHNTDLFIFALKDKDAHLNLPVSSYIVTKYKGEDGKDVIRPYTPINHNEPGELHLLVKTYPRGLMSKHIHQLKVGDQLEIKGPLPKFDYHANQKKDVAFVVGGTGITPCLQVLEAILENPQDKTNVSIVFANTSTADILLKDRIDAAAASRKNVKVTYVIDKPEPGFHGETGYLNAEMLKKYLPKPSKDTMVFACGPPPFMNAVSGPKTPDYKQGEVTGALKELGFDSSNVFKF